MSRSASDVSSFDFVSHFLSYQSTYIGRHISDVPRMIQEYPIPESCKGDNWTGLYTYKKIARYRCTNHMSCGQAASPKTLHFLNTRIIQCARLAHTPSGSRHQVLTTKVIFAATRVSCLLSDTYAFRNLETSQFSLPIIIHVQVLVFCFYRCV